MYIIQVFQLNQEWIVAHQRLFKARKSNYIRHGTALYNKINKSVWNKYILVGSGGMDCCICRLHSGSLGFKQLLSEVCMVGVSFPTSPSNICHRAISHEHVSQAPDVSQLLYSHCICLQLQLNQQLDLLLMVVHSCCKCRFYSMLYYQYFMAFLLRIRPHLSSYRAARLSR